MSDFLTVTGLDKGFPYGGGRLEVLCGVTFSLPAGTTASIIGDSGSGKSTLLHVVGGMEPPDAGRVLVGDTDLYTIAGDARARFRNRQIGFVFQFHHLLPEFSALENLMMPLLVRGVGAAEASAAATALIAELGLDHRTASRPGELSGGEQQRVAVGRALITEPALLLMDEPTGNLDHGTGDRTMELVLGLTARRGTTVLLVTHNPALADRCAVRFRMTEGRLERI
ncbi:MAG TPA: ABC transporter ATP-binding protein [Acidobacteriota bacterium]|nr:ABC transporter ATP-binding protein [Acidobacteriota bacterium]HOT02396.1 ABC transporter ATP-binding protein [Acidobacteriota bacterium]HQF88446.1 ABC transporter ATP-binding protein [Acidobacteriota bacterium]HQG92857.1 ABC transporter ATP-binding protein [Acidobacteriota bacterium]HQK87999.1 ABC transporter ATP-binding protein [Acidobacteriota bacterium]